MLSTADVKQPLLPSSRIHGFMGQTIDLAGQRFGKLVVVELSHRDNGVWWKCRCDCGGETVVRGGVLRYGSTKSCGCGSKDQARANCAKRRNVNHWVPEHLKKKLKDLYGNMVRRCYDTSNKRYANYGGRGVRVCDAWLAPGGRQEFFRWCLEHGYEAGLQIDRVNVDGPYSPENCRFADAVVQMNNTTRNRWLTHGGQTRTVADWARQAGIGYATFKNRIDRGWEFEKALTVPVRGTVNA